MIVLRCDSGLSSAGGVVISRAVATDLYRGREMTFLWLNVTINGLGPIISLILGVYCWNTSVGKVYLFSLH